MSLFANYEFSKFRIKIRFLIFLNFSCYISKRIRRNLDVYKSIARKNLLML